MVLDEDGIEARFTISLPAQGRTILGNEAALMFKTQVPKLENSLMFASHDTNELTAFIDCIEDQEVLRQQLRLSGEQLTPVFARLPLTYRVGLVAFVINGAILPRASGVSDLPLSASKKSTVHFESPPSLLNSFYLPHRGKVEGMGIPKGVTMIAGGGFHGKSTLLDALAKGCYNHVPGGKIDFICISAPKQRLTPIFFVADGREFVVTSPNIVSLQSEDGRSIRNVDISPFIGKLPGDVKTTSFCTEDASGSTSMAAGVVEALELGADTLLFDEDTCATNFLIKDTRMQRLIKADPIKPLAFSVRTSPAILTTYLYNGCFVSCHVGPFHAP